jgi:RNA polymerase sigma-70 factor, ECF subfamily
MDPFEDIYDRHSAAVRRFALFLTGDPARADDLVADVFVRAWVARERIQLPTVRAYLMTIARNLHRDEQRASSPPGVPLDETVADRRPSVYARLEGHARLEDVRRRLRGVARGDRRALLLYVVREMSYGDIAELLGITVGAVKSRIARARAALRPPLESRRAEGVERHHVSNESLIVEPKR